MTDGISDLRKCIKGDYERVTYKIIIFIANICSILQNKKIFNQAEKIINFSKNILHHLYALSDNYQVRKF